jgi:hypothetical protein
MLHKWFRSARLKRRSLHPPVPTWHASWRNVALPKVEALEARYAPSCTSSIINRVLTVQCDNTSANDVTADVVVNDLGYFTVINGQLFSYSAHDSIRINGGSAGLTTYIHANGKPLSLFGAHDNDFVHIGGNNYLRGIQARLDIENPLYYNGVFITDGAGNAPSGTINVVNVGGYDFERVTGLGAGAPMDFKVADTNSVELDVFGTSGAPINVLATAALRYGTGVVSFLNTPVTTPVNVGNNGSVQGIQGALGIFVETGARSAVQIVLDDSADNGNHSVYDVGSNQPPISRGIIGLAPGQIVYGAGPGSSLLLKTGTGTETVDVVGTMIPTTVEGHSANTTVNVGSHNNSPNKLDQIVQPLTITNPPSFSHVNINDSADTANHSNVMLTATSLTGLTAAAAPINFGADDLASLTITGGRGTNIYTVVTTQNSGVPGGNPTTLNTGSGADTVNVQGTSGAGLRLTGQGSTTTANLGFNNALFGIQSPVTIVNSPSLFNVTVNDAADNNNHSNVQLISNSLMGLAPAPIIFINTGSGLTINGGGGTSIYTVAASQPLFSIGGTTLNTDSGRDFVYVQATVGNNLLTINAGSGTNTVGIGSPANTLDTDQSVMVVHGSGAPLQVTLNDQANANPATWSVSGSYVGRTGTGGAGAFISGVTQLVIVGGLGGNTFDLSQGVATATSVTLHGGGGSNKLIGSNARNSWQMIGADAGLLRGSAYAGPIGFDHVGNLTAGSGGDTFLFSDQATLSGSVMGGGNTTLDYTLYSTSVIVDLQTGIATGVGGSVSGILNVIGGSGAPGSGAYNLLIGNGGNTLSGGIGRRNILVAGGSASTLIGGDNDDLLIGGTTLYDTDPALASWLQIAAYWAGTDDYFTRVANLSTGSGVPLLDATVVTGNGGGNTMIGNGALALIYSDGNDSITGFDPNSQTVAITP